MRSHGAALVRYALEQIGVQHTFGIPGVHNTELYDELDRSEQITPHLVTSEFCGGFAADAVTRLGGLGVLAIVPAAGLTHAASGIAEAYLDGVAMLVITGGVKDHGKFQNQLHGIDQARIADGFTKGSFKITDAAQAVDTVYRAYDLATGGVPGPVLVELPVDVAMETTDVPDPVPYTAPKPQPLPPAVQLDKAAAILAEAKRPALFLGWGAMPARSELVRLAELLDAPVATTLQGLAVFPGDHPLHAGFTFGSAGAPASRHALADHDAMLAIGVRFGEIATGSFGIKPPKNLVQVDIDREAIDANYPARIGLVGDSGAIVPELVARLEKLKEKQHQAARPSSAGVELRQQIAQDKASYRAEFAASGAAAGRVNPADFFAEVQKQVDQDVIVTIDDGNHTFLTAELWTVTSGADLIGPSDFNAMGYAVPAAVGAKTTHPEREVITFVGDGCLRMSGLELASLTAQGLGTVTFVFNDGELSQISQAQQVPYNDKACTVLPALKVEGIALASGARYLSVSSGDQLGEVVAEARRTAAGGQPVVVDVFMDYSRTSVFTSAIVKTNLRRFPLRDIARLVGRAGMRRLPGRGK